MSCSAFAPGTRAPHIPVLRDGTPVSTRDLYGHHFVLLHAARQHAWAAAADQASQQPGIPIGAQPIGGRDPAGLQGNWAASHGITPDGAVLVRPDGIIAWRAPDIAGAARLEQALRTVLRREQDS